MQLRVADMIITRRQQTNASFPVAVANDREDGLRVVSHLTDLGHYRLWKSGELAFEGRRPKGLTDITSLRDEWQYHHLAPFDVVEFKFPLSFIHNVASEAGRPEFRSLETALGTADPVILGLSRALLPFFGNRGDQQTSPLFLESVTSALLVHLMQTYGGVYFPARDKGTLAPWQERRSLEFLRCPSRCTAFACRSRSRMRRVCQLLQQDLQEDIRYDAAQVAQGVSYLPGERSACWKVNADRHCGGVRLC